MPPIPSVDQTILNGQLGVSQPSFSRVQAKIGVCSAGVPNTVYQFADSKLMTQTIGFGEVVEAAAQAMKYGPVIVVPVLPSVVGSVGSTTLVGSGTGTVTGAKAMSQIVKVKIILGGAVGVATYQVAIGSGAYGPTTLTASSARVVGAPLVVLNFAAGTYVANDVYQLNLDGTVTRTGSGTATLLNTSTFEPLDSYDVRVQIMGAGGLGVGSFRYSLDGGDNYSATILIPSGGVYQVPAGSVNSGIQLTFSGTFTLSDLYSFSVTGPSYSSSDVTAAMTALAADPRKWFLVHVVGQPTSAANAATLFGAVAAKMDAFEAVFRYARALIECPQNSDLGGSNTDAAAITAFQNLADTRVAVGIGDVEMVSAIDGNSDRRNVAWAFAARLSQIAPGESAAAVARGALSGVRSIYRDENAVQALNDQRFVTARTWIGVQGYYITDDKVMDVAGGDFGNMTRGRVMDIAADAVRSRFVFYVNASVRVDKKTGYIDERDAQRIELDVQSVGRQAVVVTGDATDLTVKLNRTTALLTTDIEPASTGIIPLAYLRHINNSIGFVNPALGT